MQATERLYLTADRKKVVREGDPKAATLYAAPGDEIPDEAADRFGLKDGGLKKKSANGGGEQSGNGGRKQSDKGGNKQGSKGGNKSGGLTVKKGKGK